jgi:hypothetical protein
MRLDREKLTQAVNIALNDHLPMRQTRMQTLSDWKGLGGPEAARNAVFAAMLAHCGITGPAPIFEGRAGFFHMVSGGPVDVDVDTFGGRGIPFKINQCSMKAYPAQTNTQTALSTDRMGNIYVAASSVDLTGPMKLAGAIDGYLTATRLGAVHERLGHCQVVGRVKHKPSRRAARAWFMSAMLALSTVDSIIWCFRSPAVRATATPASESYAPRLLTGQMKMGLP